VTLQLKFLPCQEQINIFLLAQLFQEQGWANKSPNKKKASGALDPTKKIKAVLTGVRPFPGPGLPFCLPVL
jgi:hypothetical protein